jgi:Ferroportin1 (FPN1)
MVASEVSPLLTVGGTASNDKDNDEKLMALRVARRFLYASHLSAQFSEQTWQFSLLLFLAAFTNYSSVFLVSTYGLLSGLSVCLAGPAAGRYFVDSCRWSRLFAAQVLIGTQNLCVLVATACCYYVLVSLNSNVVTNAHNGQEEAILDWFQERLPGVPLTVSTVLLVVGIHIFGSTAQVFDSSFLVAIERDWIVVMDQASKLHHVTRPEQTTNTSAWLSETNVVMKQIDLGCKVVAPAVAGFLLGAASPHTAMPTQNNTAHTHGANQQTAAHSLATAALLVGMINSISLAVEYFCTARIYKLVPALAIKTDTSVAKDTRSTNDIRANLVLPSSIKDETSSQESVSVPSHWVAASLYRIVEKVVPSGLRTYFSEKISWAGLGLAML